jgi:hypothetical protein
MHRMRPQYDKPSLGMASPLLHGHLLGLTDGADNLRKNDATHMTRVLSCVRSCMNEAISSTEVYLPAACYIYIYTYI